MRSRLFICAALAGTFVLGNWSRAAHADPKAKGNSKKATSSDSDDKVISKQLQWEDSVMGPDDKQAELAKIARAQAINKAAAEKAAKEKEKADAQAAREKERADAAPKTSKRGGEVALPTLPDEDSGKSKNGRTSEISPKLETATAAAPPPPVKHGDDKFIDKLLKDDGGNKKHKVSASEDKALDDLLAVDKPESKGKGKGKKDDVDALLSAKPQPMPETHVKHETPEWAKPEISSTPVEVAMPIRQQPKKDDGIIHVVQGAATPTGRAVPASHRTVAPPPPVRTSAVATRAPASRRQAAPAAGNWDDPFADRSAPKKTVAARETHHHNDSGADDLDDVAPVRRRAPATRGSNDLSGNAKAAGSRRATPAAKPKWKDPFTESAAPTRPARTTLAAREPHHRESSESSKWEVAGRHTPAATEGETTHSRSGRWGVLKKHAH
jgi:hypothetical protein